MICAPLLGILAKDIGLIPAPEVGKPHTLPGTSFLIYQVKAATAYLLHSDILGTNFCEYMQTVMHYGNRGHRCYSSNYSNSLCLFTYLNEIKFCDLIESNVKLHSPTTIFFAVVRMKHSLTRARQMLYYWTIPLALELLFLDIQHLVLAPSFVHCHDILNCLFCGEFQSIRTSGIQHISGFSAATFVIVE